MTRVQPDASSASVSARAGDEEHVAAAATRHALLPPRLDVAHGLAVRLDDVRADVRPAQAIEHLAARERLVVPVARDLRFGVPRDEQVGVVLGRRPDLRQAPV